MPIPIMFIPLYSTMESDKLAYNAFFLLIRIYAELTCLLCILHVILINLILLNNDTMLRR